MRFYTVTTQLPLIDWDIKPANRLVQDVGNRFGYGFLTSLHVSTTLPTITSHNRTFQFFSGASYWKPSTIHYLVSTFSGASVANGAEQPASNNRKEMRLQTSADVYPFNSSSFHPFHCQGNHGRKLHFLGLEITLSTSAPHL